MPLPATLQLDQCPRGRSSSGRRRAGPRARTPTDRERPARPDPDRHLADRVTAGHACMWISRALQLEPAARSHRCSMRAPRSTRRSASRDIVEEQDAFSCSWRAAWLSASTLLPPAIEASDDEPTRYRRRTICRTWISERASKRCGRSSPGVLRVRLGRADLRQAAELNAQPQPGDVETAGHSSCRHPSSDALCRHSQARRRSPTERSARAHESPARVECIAQPLPDDWTRRLWLAAATTLVIGRRARRARRLVSFPGRAAVHWVRSRSKLVPAGIAVTIDGTPRGVTPLAIELPAGDHLVELVTDDRTSKDSGNDSRGQ